MQNQDQDSRDFASTLAARDPRDPCPTCSAVGGYCGGENHPSCGCFHNGTPVSLVSFNKKPAVETTVVRFFQTRQKKEEK